MKTASKKFSVLALAALTTALLGTFNADGADITSVDVKCQITYFNSPQKPSPKPFVRTLALKVEPSQGGVNYKFDHMEKVKVDGKPDQILWISGNYFHNDNEVNSYLRYSSSACEIKSGTKGLKCYGSDYSGDVYANVVKATTIYHGKKLQMAQTAVTTIDFSKGLEVEANYRLQTGHSMLDDLDMNDPKQRERYFSFVSPVFGATCSVRDDAFGVVSAFN
jgi:hypothetical protein